MYIKSKNVLIITILLISALLLAACGGNTGGAESSEDSLPSSLEAPSLVGKMWNSTLASEILPIKPVVIYDNNSTAPKGQITAQHPEAGTTVYCDDDGVCRSVEITVSNKDNKLVYQSVVGINAEEAMAKLEAIGISKAMVFRKYKANTTSVGNGCVSSFTYSHGGAVEDGAEIKDTDEFVMTINSAARSVSVPDLGGKSFDEAVELLYASKLNIGEISYKESGFADDTVISQTPTADETAYHGDEVDLVLSRHEGEFEMPSLLGLTVDEAKKLLKKHGLELGTVTEESNREYQRGTVCAQSVEEGDKVYASTVIDLVTALGGAPDEGIDWDANPIMIDISENSLLSAGTVELLGGNYASKKAFASAGSKYTWTLPIGTFYPEGDDGMELGVEINKGKECDRVLSAFKAEFGAKQATVFVPKTEKDLPDGLELSLDLGASFSGCYVLLYHYDENDEFTELTKEPVSVSESGYAEFELNKAGGYVAVLYEEEKNPTESSEDSSEASE